MRTEAILQAPHVACQMACPSSAGAESHAQGFGRFRNDDDRDGRSIRFLNDATGHNAALKVPHLAAAHAQSARAARHGGAILHSARHALTLSGGALVFHEMFQRIEVRAMDSAAPVPA
jgi:hypothetical protein